MQYKNNIKISIDKRKLEILLRVGCPENVIWETIKTGKITKTGDKLIDDNLETFMDIKEFNNWGGNHNKKGINQYKQKKKLGQVDRHLDHQVVQQDAGQVADIDKDKDKDKDKDNLNTTIKKFNTEIENIINNINDNKIKEKIIEWVEYKKEKKESYTPIGLKKCIAKLERLSNNNPDLVMRIVDESISNNWSGLFPIKDKKTKSQIINEKNLEFVKQAWGC